MPDSEALIKIIAWLVICGPVILISAFSPAHGLSEAQQDESFKEGAIRPLWLKLVYSMMALLGFEALLPLSVTGNEYERQVARVADARRDLLSEYRRSWDPRYR